MSTLLSPPTSRPDNQPTHGISLHIQGMTCGSCVARVDKALRSVPGVVDAAVNLATGMASVKGSAPTGQLVQAVDRAGYSAKILASGQSSAQTLRDVSAAGQARERIVRNRLIIGALAGVPVVLIELLRSSRLVPIHPSAGPM